MRRVFTVLVVFIFAAAGAGAGRAADSPTVYQLYLAAYGGALSRHAFVQGDGTTYVTTGDIRAEWLRDSSAIARPYITLAKADPQLAGLLRGIIARQAKCILLDPYANAFLASYGIYERKFELDSLLYPIWLAHAYWQKTGDASIFTADEGAALDRILAVMRDEQHHNARSTYRHRQLTRNGLGTPVMYTGMVWTAFRPSDDPARYHFNIPVNMLAVVILHDLVSIERDVYHNESQGQNAGTLADEIQNGIEQYGTTTLDDIGKIYAYEVDGRGHYNLMDDANVPSLLSIPYIGYLPASDPTYQNTRRFALSDRNPYFYRGKYAWGIGSPHTPRGNIWPLALVVQALTSTDDAEIERVLGYILVSDTGDHRLHESFNSDAPEVFTRADFAWPNALYAELVALRSY